MHRLELKHIAPYLPYGLKVLRPDNKTILDVEGIVGNLFIFHEIGKLETYGSIRSSANKPILRPLSDLTKEIEHNGERFVPADNFYKIDDEQCFSHSRLDEIINIVKLGLCKQAPYMFVEKLIEWHIDIFGLIPQGLAIDINTLNK